MASGSISPNLISGLSFRDSILLLMVLLTTVLGVLLIHVALHTWVIGGGKAKNGTSGNKKMQRTEEVVVPVETTPPQESREEEQINEDGFPEILLNKTVRFLLPIQRVQREPRKMERLLKRRNAITADNYLATW